MPVSLVTMRNRFPLQAGWMVLVAGWLPANGHAQRPRTPMAFTRLDTSRLEAPDAGVAVIRDSVAWRTSSPLVVRERVRLR